MLRRLLVLLTAALMLSPHPAAQAGQKGIFLAYYEFATGTLGSPYSYPPDVPTATSNALLSEINSNSLVHPWGGAQVQANIATLVSLRTSYPSVPISIAVNGGADGAYWHDAGSVYDADFHTAMQQLRAAGIKIFGYIDPTVYTVGLASAKEKVDRWYSFYGDVLDGIFIDDYAVAGYLPTWPYLSVAYYDELNQYIRAKVNSSQPSVVPLIVGNINGWNDPNNTNYDAAYFASAHACDFWLVEEGNGDIADMNPAGVPIEKKWLLRSGISSASVSDAQFDSMMSHVDWVMLTERSYAAYQFLPNWLTRQAQLLAAMNGDAPASVALSGVFSSVTVGSVVASASSSAAVLSDRSGAAAAFKTKTGTPAVFNDKNGNAL